MSFKDTKAPADGPEPEGPIEEMIVGERQPGDQAEANPYRLEDFMIPETEFSALMAGKGTLNVYFGNPKKFEFFRTHSDWQFAGRLYTWEEQGKIDKEYYLLSPKMTPEESGVEEDEARTALLRAAVTATGIVYLIPTYPNSDNAWHKSAIAAVAQAEVTWLRMTPSKADGQYLAKPAANQKAMGNNGEPVWPKEIEQGRDRMLAIIRRAFGPTGLINSRDHEALKRHRGSVR